MESVVLLSIQTKTLCGLKHKIVSYAQDIEFFIKICMHESFTVTQVNVLGCYSKKITSFQQLFLIKEKESGMMLQNCLLVLCKEHF